MTLFKDDCRADVGCISAKGIEEVQWKVVAVNKNTESFSGTSFTVEEHCSETVNPDCLDSSANSALGVVDAYAQTILLSVHRKASNIAGVNLIVLKAKLCSVIKHESDVTKVSVADIANRGAIYEDLRNDTSNHRIVQFSRPVSSVDD